MAPTESSNHFQFYLPDISDSSSFSSLCPLFLRIASDHICSFLPPTHSAPGRTSSLSHSIPISSFRLLRDKVQTCKELERLSQSQLPAVQPRKCPLLPALLELAQELPPLFLPCEAGLPVSHIKPSMALLQAFHQTTLSSSTYLSLVFRICSS